MIQSLKLGNCELYFLNDGDFSVDCGVYFGIIPMVIWRKLVQADELNRCQLHIGPLLVKTPQHRVLIDPGIGDKYSEKFIQIYNIKRLTTLEMSLREINLSTEDIDVVIATHLHFDHIGAATKYNEHHEAVPVFNNARHYFQRGEWMDAINPDARTKGSYFLENYLPLKQAKLVQLIDGDNEIVPHIRVEITGGHTKFHQAVFIDSDENTAVYWGDLAPDVNHLPIAYVAAIDLYPVQVMQKRREYYQRAIDEKWLVCLDHDEENRVGYISFDGKKYCFKNLSKWRTKYEL